MSTLDTLVLIAEVILGIILLFGGYKFRKYIMWIAWFCVGYMLVKLVGPRIIHDVKILFLAEVLGGLILAVFSFDLTIISEYLLGLFAGFTLVTSFTGLTVLGVILGIVVGVIFAILAVRYSKLIIILATAYLGAHLIAPALPVVFTKLTIQPNVIAIILFVIGALVQFFTTYERKNYEED
jgi:hypothetical protein